MRWLVSVLRPKIGLKWLFILFMLAADYCLKYNFAVRDMKRNYVLTGRLHTITIWVPLYIRYELKGRLTENRHSFVGALGFYYEIEGRSSMIHPSSGKSIRPGTPSENP